MRIDVQTHHMPAAYVKALQGRSAYPRFEKKGDQWWALGTPHDTLPMAPKLLTLSMKVEEMEASGVDFSLLSINIPGPDLAPDPREADDLARISNDGIAEAAAAHPGKLRGVANLGYGDMKAAARELERCLKDLNFAALQVFAYVGAKRPLDAPELDPIWAILEERGAPLVLHPGPSPASPIYADHWLGPMVGFLFDESLAALRLILGGVLERHPRLKVLLPHGGATLPLLIGRVDSLSQRYRDDKSLALPHPPSHYFARFHTDTVVHSREGLAFALQQMGAGRVMFATDSPWVPMKRHVEIVESLGLTPAEAGEVWSGTAKAFFGL
ncbi:MAG: amidohydrolase [Candidatus Tectomicrobia bacterium]|uniref:Amidohydrolase n=1 Tax=Tectimicrobiota bacterium TaxID=2528274 RepID=A0A932MNH8_UNCTE|nr:amidohydrolase [Candidatus Tectomicrobia bacterium]